MSNPEQAKVITTRWWWVRHAPVRSDGGNIYGQEDIDCDTGDSEVFEAVAKILPRNAVWYSSNLKRTHETAEAIWAAGFPKPASMTQERDFAEQHLGQWQGMNRAAFLASRPVGSTWFADVNEPAPGGESYMDLYTRVCRTIVRINAAEAGRDVIAVGHGGVIKCAVGLALGGQPDRGLAFDIDNVSVTRLDHVAASGLSTWRLPMVNQQPWIADVRHAAMHQQAGPEVRPATKLA
ncbi:histidine phosphatase family protein [Bradyrhizobium sp. ISRA443]|uniref:histidine phosphatase family protein n=1 Tax=unclassified Bradyrhizobium TaxID=2631580 RepID=UPI002478C489|nr:MULTISPECIES: histidine phosphatase family protein [unclassified Bradyrhizobium]WGR91615.1 histidine phosphatase family protein [Bradyrhizobium sp. ISRA435]WGS01924.1 histidine phosphatase family protein [Bradyrhizobium sp. ISRA436]WGS08810.1 histidine phosphatase family protein [Bradyrhizobium sp. ISRA437]WGS15698.1 histidine phosphatase family protein [Bradyrhizobium sp. ISRA443]